jgi:cytochrome c-type biogenesis protein CcmH
VRIAAGDSDEQVEHYLVARYGDFILMKPPLEPETYLLWFGPVVVLLIGGAVVALVVVRARKRAASADF